jgi:hypothetical protein
VAQYHLAQVNIGRVKGPLEDPIMAGFVNRLDELNALADASPGFVWRLQTTREMQPISGHTHMTIVS